MRAGQRTRTALRHLVPGAAAVLAVVLAGASASSTTDRSPVPDLTLVTLVGPGTAASGEGAGTPDERAALLARQDALLAEVGAGQPVYRWTTALNGFAARLDPEQVATLARHPDVASVEANRVVRLAGRASTAPTAAGVPRTRGGAGVVIGFVDTGLDPDSPVLAGVPGLGPDPRDWAGVCGAGEGWGPDTCNRKVVGGGWFVAGFGTDRLRASEVLSARDVLGHGTQVASVAAGNAGVSVRVGDRASGRFGGLAPQARVAAYKACWAAPDPADDGCATADLVSAVDRATADGVDVLTLALADDAGPAIGTVERALLGAAEADVVVVAAAGGPGRSAFAAWQAPWVTTVGGLAGQVPEAAVAVAGGPRLRGAGRGTAVAGRLLLATAAAAPGASPGEARTCLPGSLDARLVSGRVVLCERGGTGRVDKSAAVERADGVGMVLVNERPGALTADFHSVPTVHLSVRDGAVLRRWAADHPRTRVRLAPLPSAATARRTAPWSAPGDPRGLALKPDVVALGQDVLGAVPDTRGEAWSLFSGTSAATARASGLAALLRSRHEDWPATVVRSVLTTTATPVRGSSVLHQGSGALGREVRRTHLALDVSPDDWRRALERHDWAGLNTSTLLLRGARRTALRTVTNIGPRAEYFSVTTEGFSPGRVRVTPAAVRLAPGESHAFRVTVAPTTGPTGLDDGWVVWRGARGGVTRIPVAITR